MSTPIHGWSVAWTFARRELRSGLKGFRIFFACLVLGVAAIAAVGSISSSFVAGLKQDGRMLLGGDLDLRLTHREATPDQLTYLEDTAARLSRTIEMRAMARPEDPEARRSLIELKAVDDAYPLTGGLELDTQDALRDLIAQRDGVWGAVVDRNLLVRLDKEVGARVSVGDTLFEIRAVIEREPDRVASVFSFGPRFMIAGAALDATGLVQPGSQTRYYYRVLLPQGTDIAAYQDGLAEAFPEAGWRIRTLDEAAPGIRRFIDRMTLFLSFVGLTVLLVGGIGVTNAVAGYLDTKTATVATLKCLGAPGDLIFRVYLLQILVLGLAAIVIGLGIGAVIPVLGLESIAAKLPVQPAIGVYGAPLIQAAGFGLLSAFTFALWPLARAREVPAAQLFRDRIAPAGGRPRGRYIAFMAAGVIGLAALTIGTADQKNFAMWFVIGAVLTLLILRVSAWIVKRLAGAVKRPPNARIRMVLANLTRPASSVTSIMTSLGLGMSVLVAIGLMETNMARQVSERLPDRAPAFFFLDIQPHQVAAFDETVTTVPGTSGFKRVPTLRGRITQIDGTPVEEAVVAPESQWAIRGDRALSFAAEMPTGSDLVAGEWWPKNYSGSPLISLDAGIARGFGVDVGDTLTLNILGRPVVAEIASLREIDWRSLQFDFAIIFAPGTLEGAPHTHIAAIEAPEEAEDTLERKVADGFANISAIRVREALAAAARMVAGIGLAVQGVALVTVLAGALVLAGTIAASHRRHVYDAVVFKVLGATRSRIASTFLMEYGALGFVTAMIAAVVGTLTAYGVVAHLMRADWAFDASVVLKTSAFCLGVTLIMGFIGTWRALGQPASPHLRNE